MVYAIAPFYFAALLAPFWGRATWGRAKKGQASYVNYREAWVTRSPLEDGFGLWVVGFGITEMDFRLNAMDFPQNL